MGGSRLPATSVERADEAALEAWRDAALVVAIAAAVDAGQVTLEQAMSLPGVARAAASCAADPEG